MFLELIWTFVSSFGVKTQVFLSLASKNHKQPLLIIIIIELGSQNIVLCQCLTDQLIASAFAIGK